MVGQCVPFRPRTVLRPHGKYHARGRGSKCRLAPVNCLLPIRVALVALVARPAPVAAQGGRTDSTALVARIQHVIGRPEFRHAFFGIEFYSLDADRPLYALNGEKLFTAASTTKLLTEGTALRLLGADYRYHTRLYRTGPITPDGTVQGDLVLVASGDPNLSGRIQAGDTLGFTNVDHAYDASPDTRAVPGDPLLVIRALARQVAAHRVRRIAGQVLVDAGLFAEGARELGTGVVISPIIINDNLVDLMIGPGATEGAPTTVSISPVTSYVRFVNTSVTGRSGSPTRIEWSSDVREADGSHTVTISGSVPAGVPPILFSYAVPEPSRFAQVTLVQALRETGITVEVPAAGTQHAPVSLTATPPATSIATPVATYTPENVVAEHVSPPLSEDIKVTLKVSQNLHASAMPFILKAILAKQDTGRTGFDLERDFLTRAGLDLGGAQQSDGAGGDARFSPDFMVHYLAYMARQKDFEVFSRALPILGRDGTLWNIQPASAAAGHVRAKTGTLGGYDALNRRLLVAGKGLAGYFTTASGRRYAFAAYVNNVSVTLAPDEAARVAGQALGEIAAAGYEMLP